MKKVHWLWNQAHLCLLHQLCELEPFHSLNGDSVKKVSVESHNHRLLSLELNLLYLSSGLVSFLEVDGSKTKRR